MSKDLEAKVESKAIAPTTPAGNTIFDLVKKMGPQIQMALPKHLNSERFVRIALTCLRNNPQLANCNRESFLAALMQSAQIGLEPSTLGQCYILPYKNEAKLIIGYQGMINLVRRSGEIADIYAEIIYANDDYSIEFGLDRDLKHKPNLLSEDRGEPVLVYAVARLKDGSCSFVVMTMTEINKIKLASPSASSSSSPWKSWPDMMMRKSAIKRLCRYLPISIEIASMINTDETTKKDIAPDMAIDVMPIVETEHEAEPEEKAAQ